jgi:hypothetical protein
MISRNALIAKATAKLESRGKHAWRCFSGFACRAFNNFPFYPYDQCKITHQLPAWAPVLPPIPNLTSLCTIGLGAAPPPLVDGELPRRQPLPRRSPYSCLLAIFLRPPLPPHQVEVDGWPPKELELDDQPTAGAHDQLQRYGRERQSQASQDMQRSGAGPRSSHGQELTSRFFLDRISVC